jgi:hypothetical protein
MPNKVGTKEPATMPAALEEKLKAVDLEVRSLHFKWKFFSQLFTDPKRVEILNAAAAALFQSVEDSMLSDMFLSIARLTDRSESLGQENLSLENLLREIPDDSLRMHAEALLAQVKDKTRAIKVWRNKKPSHNDLPKAPGIVSLPSIQKKDFTDTLDLIPKIIDPISKHFSDTMTMYEECITSNDGDSLLFYLEYGLDARDEDKKNSNLDRRHKLQKRWAQKKRIRKESATGPEAQLSPASSRLIFAPRPPKSAFAFLLLLSIKGLHGSKTVTINP